MSNTSLELKIWVGIGWCIFLVQTLGKTVWEILMKLIKHLPYEITIPFIEIYSRKIRIYVSQKQIMDAYRGYIDVSLKLETTQMSLERNQNKWDPNISLWHVDNFELKTIKSQETQHTHTHTQKKKKKKNYFYLSYLKEFRQCPGYFRVRAITRDSLIWVTYLMAAQHLITKHISYCPTNYLPPLWRLRPSNHFLAQDSFISLNCSTFPWASYTYGATMHM